MLIDKYWKGICSDDVNSLEALYKESYNYLIRYAVYLTENQLIAEEVVQDIFIKIWEDRHKLSITISVKSYLYKAVHNHCLNVIARTNTQREKVNKLISGEKWQQLVEWMDFEDPIIERIEANETENRIKQIVSELPEQCKKVFELSRFENKSNKEIAISLKISENTVKSQIYRALQVIRKKLF